MDPEIQIMSISVVLLFQCCFSIQRGTKQKYLSMWLNDKITLDR